MMQIVTAKVSAEDASDITQFIVEVWYIRTISALAAYMGPVLGSVPR